VIAERYIYGKHLTIDGYCDPIGKPFTLALACNTKFDGGEGVINESILYPGNLAVNKYEEAWILAEKTANVLKYKFGLFHGEFIVEQESEEIFLTEMSNRGGGVHISNISVPHVSGFSVYENYINNLLGNHSITSWHRINSRQLNMKFFYNPNLVGKKVEKWCQHQLETCLNIPQVLAVKLFPTHDGCFMGYQDGVRRHGMIIVATNVEEDIQALTTKAEKQLFCQINTTLF